MHSVYKEMRPVSLDLRSSDMKEKAIEDVAELIASRFDEVHAFLNQYARSTWITNYVMEVQRQKGELLSQWASKASWRKLASGKKIIDDLYTAFEITMRKVDFKKEIMVLMAKNKTDDWRIIDQILRSELS